MDVDLQQRPWVVAGPTRAGRFRLEAKAGDIQLVDKLIDDPHRAVFADVVIDPFRK